ncbi:MAG: hypothetical protein IJW22_03895 [Clostridia bacterium]|nr:hypothetical protein [Clostridia bacterium]
MKKVKLLMIPTCYLGSLALLALDWPFWNGYLGFGLTFLTLFVFSLPFAVAAAGVALGVYDSAKKKSAWHSWLCLSVGAVVLCDYLLSFLGVFAGSALLGAAYAVLPLGTVALLGLGCYRIFVWKRSQR